MLVEKSVHDFIEIVDSNEPVPGGGSVSALAGSIAAALGRMVGSLTFNKKRLKNMMKVFKIVLEKALKNFFH